MRSSFTSAHPSLTRRGSATSGQDTTSGGHALARTSSERHCSTVNGCSASLGQPRLLDVGPWLSTTEFRGHGSGVLASSTCVLEAGSWLVVPASAGAVTGPAERPR